MVNFFSHVANGPTFCLPNSLLLRNAKGNLDFHVSSNGVVLVGKSSIYRTDTVIEFIEIISTNFHFRVIVSFAGFSHFITSWYWPNGFIWILNFCYVLEKQICANRNHSFRTFTQIDLRTSINQCNKNWTETIPLCAASNAFILLQNVQQLVWELFVLCNVISNDQTSAILIKDHLKSIAMCHTLQHYWKYCVW